MMQAGGYTRLKGALGYAGMNWSVLVRVPLDEAAKETYAIQRNIVIAALICLALLFLISMMMGRRVISRLKPVMEVAERATQSDLTCRVPVMTWDELGQMGAASNGFLDQLNRMLHQITQLADTIAASSEQMSANGGQVARASREQSNQATQVALAVEEMSATANEMAKHTQVPATTAQEVNQLALRGGDVVTNGIQGMETVTTTMQASADRINAPGQRSREIGRTRGERGIVQARLVGDQLMNQANAPQDDCEEKAMRAILRGADSYSEVGVVDGRLACRRAVADDGEDLQGLTLLVLLTSGGTSMRA